MYWHIMFIVDIIMSLKCLFIHILNVIGEYYSIVLAQRAATYSDAAESHLNQSLQMRWTL